MLNVSSKYSFNILPKVAGAKFLGSDRLFRCISRNKFGSFKNPFVMTTHLSELHFRCRRLISAFKRSDFYEVQQQHKQLKTMEINEA